MAESNVPNLDAMEPDELMAFWKRYHRVGGKAARELFGDDIGATGYVTAARNLAHYASNKATAIQCRLRGDITTAIMYERICDDIYARLPSFAKGW